MIEIIQNNRIDRLTAEDYVFAVCYTKSVCFLQTSEEKQMFFNAIKDSILWSYKDDPKAKARREIEDAKAHHRKRRIKL